MKNLVLVMLMCAWGVVASAAETPDVVPWDSSAGQTMRARIQADADYWQLSPHFAVQATQSFCAVASAVTVLNALPIAKPVDPAYAPYAYFTQSNFFTPEVARIIAPQTVLAMGMTREQMVQALSAQGVRAKSVAGDALDVAALRKLLKPALGDDGQFVLANYFRGELRQVGGGHWSALAAYDVQTDRVLILDVAKYKYPPVWVGLPTLLSALATVDTASGQSRGLVLVSQ